MRLLERARQAGRKYRNPVPTELGGFSVMMKVLPRYLSNREEKFPKKRLGPFTTEVQAFARQPESGLRVTWMGHSSMVLEIDGVRVLVDPVWDERASPVRWLGPKRFFRAPLRLEEMPDIDVVLVSHDHYDHLGKETVRKLSGMAATAEAQWVTSQGVGAILEGFGVRRERIAEMNWTESVTVQGRRNGATLKITAVPARHFSGRGLGNRFETLWSSFVLRGAEHNVYFGADSGWWEGFTAIGEQYGPFDLALLEIGAYDELWKQIHLGPEGAARAFAELGGVESGGLMMPIHWGLFDLALHGWRQPMERLLEIAETAGIKVWSPEPGRPTEVLKGVAMRSEWWR